jgi:triacylglycerol lipase
MDTKSVAPALVRLDPDLTVASLAAANAAYSYFGNPTQPLPPVAGFKAVAGFTGWDDVIFQFGSVERFGLIYVSTSDPKSVLVAFRGTDSDFDDYEDIFADTADFQPYAGTGSFPAGVAVSSGFYDIYTTQSDAMPGSMRDQVFGWIKRLVPTTIYVTGHSLGGALANLFALDAMVSLPGTTVVNTTFASPKTGKQAFQQAYDVQYGLGRTTYRCYNQQDYVPNLPPDWIFGDYVPVGQPFAVNFTVFNGSRFDPYILSKHSLANYSTVISRAVYATPQSWTGYFPDAAATGLTMISAAPTAGERDMASELLRLNWGIAIAEANNQA